MPSPRPLAGLRYLPGYLDADTHDRLLTTIDAGPWRDFGERRAQIYGYSFHYTKGGVYRSVEQRPAWEPASWAKLRNRLRPASSSD